MNNEITSKVYDELVLRQGDQFQIDTFYAPVDEIAKKRIDLIVDAIDPKPEEKILDVGCGVGTFSFHGSKRGAVCCGIDYSRESIKSAKRFAITFGTNESSHFLLGNVTIPFKDLMFDKVVAADFIEHITLEEKEILLSEINRVLKPGGRAIIYTPNGIREKIGEMYWKVRQFMFGDEVPSTLLHFGLTNKYEFESLLKKYRFQFALRYEDITRPLLCRIPLVRQFLALNLIWTVRKHDP